MKDKRKEINKIISKTCFLAIIISMLAMPIFSLISYAEVSADEQAKKYLSVVQLRKTDGNTIGYKVNAGGEEKNVWEIEEYESNDIETPALVNQPQIYCLYEGIGFNDAQKIETYNKNFNMFLDKESIKDSSTLLKKIVANGNYNKLLNLFSYMYAPTESSDEYKEKLFEEANKRFEAKYEKLKSTDIETVNQLVIWSLANKDENHTFYTETGYIKYSTDGTKWYDLDKYKSKEDEEEGKDRQKAMESLYKYLSDVSNASSVGGFVTNNTCKIKVNKKDNNRYKIEVRSFPSREAETIYLIAEGTQVTRTKTDVAYVDGYHWDEIKFTDQKTQNEITGYIETVNLQVTSWNETCKVNYKGGLNLRSSPSKKAENPDELKYGSEVTRLERNVEAEGKEVWDKVRANVQKDDGTTETKEGYVVSKYLDLVQTVEEEDAIAQEVPATLSVEDENSTLKCTTSEGNYIVGPIKVTRNNKLNYWFDFDVTLGEEKVTDFKILDEEKRVVNENDVVEGNYYISLPVTALKKITVSMRLNYETTEATLWTKDTETEETQPVVFIDKEAKSTETTFSVTPESKPEVIKANVDISGTEKISTKDEKVNYTLKYEANIKSYLGTAVVKLVQKLPYEIDIEKSTLDGGDYDPNEKTITWEENLGEISSFTSERYTYNLSVKKNVSLVYKNIDLMQYKMTSKLDGYLFLAAAAENIEKEDEQATLINVDGTVKVKYVDQNTNQEIQDPVIHAGKVGTEYNIYDDKKEIDGYKLMKEPETKSGFYTDGEQEKVFLYAKKSTVKVKYLDKKNNDEINPEVIIDGYEGQSYNTEKKTIEGYTYVGDTENTQGVMGREDIEVIYYYSYNCQVIVKHIDNITKQEIGTDIENGLEDDIYVSAPRNFEGYVLVKEPEDKTVTMTRETIVIEYYYTHISEGVIEKHIDAVTNELLESKVYEGKEGDSYTTSSKTFKGYDLVEDNLPANSEGTMERGAIEVVYYYKKKAVVVARYIDKNTNDRLIEDVVKKGHEGDLYETEVKEFDNYKLVEVPKNQSGEMKVTKNEDGSFENKTVVEFLYVHISNGIVERHIDDYSGQILYETRHEGYEGDEYETEVKEFIGYDLVEDKKPENASGKMTIDEIVVNYYYKKRAKVVVQYKDKISDEILAADEINGHQGDDYTTERKEFEGYDFIESDGELDGKLNPDEEKVVTYYYAKKSKVIVQYLEDGTNEVLADEDIIEGHEGDEYGTTAKDINYYKLIKTAENATGIMEEETYVKYYYRKAIFDLSINKTVTRVVIDGNNKKIEDPELGKVEVYRKDVNTSNVIVEFNVAVKNEGELPGKATVVENIPEYLEMKEADNLGWKVDGEVAKYEIETIEPGETKNLRVRMIWENGDGNFGVITNNVSLQDLKNDAEYAESYIENNADDAEIIVTVSTGAQTISAVVAVLASYILAGMVAYVGLTFKKTEE